MRIIPKLVAGAIACMAALPLPDAQATVIFFDYQLANTSPLQGPLPTPAGSIEITQIAPGQVGFLLKNTIDGPYDGPTFESKLLLNYTGSLALTAQQWNIAAPAGFTLQPFSTGGFAAASGSTSGYSGFDIVLSFPTSNGPNSDRFKDHEYFAWTYSGNGLLAEDFLTPIAADDPSRPPSPVMIHVQGINGDPGSFWIVDQPPARVPEPSSIALLGIGLAGVALARRRQRPA